MSGRGYHVLYMAALCIVTVQAHGHFGSNRLPISSDQDAELPARPQIPVAEPAPNPGTGGSFPSLNPGVHAHKPNPVPTNESGSESETEFFYSKEVVLREDNLRNAIRNSKWPGGIIPFEISSLYNQNERNIIAAAMDEYHKKTCVRFVNRGNQVDYIHITPDDGLGTQVSPYCYSYVGKRGGRQIVKMYGECVRLPAMIHELGHVIGFEHEHNRADRDSYINLIWNNIDPTYYYNYNKVSASSYDSLGLVYDYYSIMHYPDYSYAKPGLKAFTLKFPGHSIPTENLILSDTDVQKIKKYYGC